MCGFVSSIETAFSGVNAAFHLDFNMASSPRSISEPLGLLLQPCPLEQLQQAIHVIAAKFPNPSSKRANPKVHDGAEGTVCSVASANKSIHGEPTNMLEDRSPGSK